MITRYFVVNPDEVIGFKSNLVPDNDFLPLSSLQSKVVATLLDGRKIIHAIIPTYLVKEMQENTNLIDPLTTEGVIALDIVNKFVGRSRADIIAKFPELDDDMTIGTDENGNDITTPKLIFHQWSGE